MSPAVSLLPRVRQQDRRAQRNQSLDGESELQQSWPQPDDFSWFFSIITVAVVIHVVRRTFYSIFILSSYILYTITFSNCNLELQFEATCRQNSCIFTECSPVVYSAVFCHCFGTTYICMHTRHFNYTYHVPSEPGSSSWHLHFLPALVLNLCILTWHHFSCS